MYKSINLDQLRDQSDNYHSKIPFQHQIEAFKALSKTFKFGSEKSSSGILVLPTGAGKTEWLLQHKPELLNFIQYQIGYTYIEDIKVNVSNKN